MHKPTKHLLRTVLLMAGVLGASASLHAEEEVLVILSSDGTRTKIALDAVQRIDLNDDGIQVRTTDSSDVAYAYDEVDRILMPHVSVGVDVVPGPGELAIWPVPVTDILNIAGAADSDAVAIYTTDGRQVASALCHEGRATIRMGSLPASVYIVTVGDRSTKIIKK